MPSVQVWLELAQLDDVRSTQLCSALPHFSLLLFSGQLVAGIVVSHLCNTDHHTCAVNRYRSRRYPVINLNQKKRASYDLGVNFCQPCLSSA